MQSSKFDGSSVRDPKKARVSISQLAQDFSERYSDFSFCFRFAVIWRA
jgi:hypothetical protein